MRIIKFRGKKLHNGKWVCGYLSDVDNTPIGKVGIINSKPFSGCEESSMVIAESIGQFTGLIDKNGKEIYEGDIVKIKTLQGIVSWHPNGYFCIHTYKCDISEVNYTAIGDMVDYIHKELYDDGLEIVGNIHDTTN